MIQLPRSFFRQLKTVLRRSFSRISSPIVFQSTPEGLSVRCQQDGIAVLHQSKEGQGNDQLVLPVHALAEIEGKGGEVVALEGKNASKVQARWMDAGVPRTVEYDSPKLKEEFPQTPNRFMHQDVTILKALDDAMQTASHDAVRFALNKIQIRGSTGVIVGTDGHSLLWQNGFQFSWADDVLVPRTNIFNCKEISGPVSIAKSKTHFCVQAGAWTILLLIDKEGRFPKFESIIPNNTANATHLSLTPDNVAFLTKALPRLPGDDDTLAAVTLDLNGEALVRARADGQEQSTEVTLSGASVSGKAVRYATNRHHLLRAFELGFVEGHVLSVESPMLFQDARRKFVFQGLGKDRVVAPSGNDVRLRSDSCESSNTQQPVQRRNEPMKASRQSAAPSPPSPAAPVPIEPTVNGNGAGSEIGNGQHAQPSTFAALLEEGQSIQNALRDLLLRTNRLMSGLKAYRRHAKTMQSTLASLRQLPQVEA